MPPPPAVAVLVLLVACCIVGTAQATIKHKYGYVAVLTEDSFAPGAIALVHSIRNFSSLPTILLLHEDVSPEVERLLRHHPFTYMLRVTNIDNPFYDERYLSLQHFKKNFAKLHVWRLVQFEKLLFTDLDFLLLGDMDHLFEHHPPEGSIISAVSDDCPHSLFNGGYFVLRPNISTFNDMMSKIALPEYKSHHSGDQFFLNTYLYNWAPLKAEYNFRKSFHNFRPRYEAYLADPKLFSRIKGLHYVGEKPWKCASKEFDCNMIVTGNKEYPTLSFFAHHGLHQLWWKVYDPICAKYPCPALTTRVWAQRASDELLLL